MDGYAFFLFQALRKYIETCLLSAIKRESKSIAFPTIGTADCGYPKDEVAQVFLRTIGEFMTKRSSSKLEEISVVIYKDDQESTMVLKKYSYFTFTKMTRTD